jgi:hypothetical protein
MKYILTIATIAKFIIIKVAALGLVVNAIVDGTPTNMYNNMTIVINNILTLLRFCLVFIYTCF